MNLSGSAGLSTWIDPVSITSIEYQNQVHLEDAMQQHLTADKYGTLPWFERAYAMTEVDPWGLTWRSSQQFRYQRTLSMLVAVDRRLERILDCGCATGDFTHLLSKCVCGARQVIGVDFVDSAVERARHRFPDVPFAKEALLGIGDRYHAHFDLITCLEVLYYIPTADQPAALRSMKAALQPGGYLLLSSMISQAPYFSPQQLIALLSHDFEIVDHEIIHLRVVSLCERLVAKAMSTLGGTEPRPQSVGRLPIRAVVTMERLCRRLLPATASHTLVLARARW